MPALFPVHALGNHRVGFPNAYFRVWGPGCPYYRSRKVCYGRAAGSSRIYRPEDGVAFVRPRFGPAVLSPAGCAAVVAEIGAETVEYETTTGGLVRERRIAVGIGRQVSKMIRDDWS